MQVHVKLAGGLLLLVLPGLAACQRSGSEPPPPVEAPIEDIDLAETGREIAESQCAPCHAIERTGDSPNPDAPPLRTVLADFDIEALATDFREHIQLGNEAMPEFDFDPIATDALMAYLLTIEDIDAE